MPAPHHPPPDEAVLFELVEQIAQGSDLAFERLWRVVEPRVEAVLRNPRLMHKLAERPAERADCKQTIAIKLRTVLPTYLAYRQDKQRQGLSPSLARWIGVVINHAVIDFRRRHPEYRRPGAGDELSERWRSFVPIDAVDDRAGFRASEEDARDRVLAAISRGRQFRQILHWARSNLSPRHFTALMSWLSADETRQSRATRAALRKLRDRFREQSS